MVPLQLPNFTSRHQFVLLFRKQSNYASLRNRSFQKLMFPHIHRKTKPCLLTVFLLPPGKKGTQIKHLHFPVVPMAALLQGTRCWWATAWTRRRCPTWKSPQHSSFRASPRAGCLTEDAVEMGGARTSLEKADGEQGTLQSFAGLPRAKLV